MEEHLMKSCESTVSVEIGAVNEENQLNSSKRRKVLYSEHQTEYVNGVSPAMSGTYGGDDDDDESNGAVKKSLRSSDLENFESHFDGFETEFSTYNEYFREMTPTRDEFVEDSEQGPMITPKKKSEPSITRRKVSSPNKLPSMTEFDEFFAEIEKSEAKRFAEKYNFDIVKDVPLEGKYQWVRLHH